MPPCNDCKGDPPARAGGGGGGPKGPASDRLKDERAFKLFTQRAKIGGGTATPQLIATVPAAAAIDVFIRYRDDSGNTEDPFGSLEQWIVTAISGPTRSQIGPARVTSEAPVTGNDGVQRQIFAIRDVPAEQFELTMIPTGVAAGSTAMFDVVIVAWGREPTGIGPFSLMTFRDGDSTPTPGALITGITVLGQDQAGGAGIWRGLTFNQILAYDPAGAGSADGTTNLNVLPVALHSNAAPVLGNNVLFPLRSNASGELLVSVSSTTSSSSKFTSAAYESSHANAGAKTVRSVVVSSRAPAAGFLFIYDLAALPVDGTLPDYPPVPIPAGPSFVSVDLAEGRVHATGLVVAFSSTANVLTISTADCWFEAHW